MTYEEMCRYIALSEGFDWPFFVAQNEIKRYDLRHTRQMCIYIGNVIFPKLSYKVLGAIFNKDHATAMHAIKRIRQEMDVYHEARDKIDTYIKNISDFIQKDNEALGVVELMNAAGEVMDTIERMRLIAEAYCRITGKKII